MQTASNAFSYELHLVEYPNISKNNTKIWRKLFKECASQRLFFPVSFVYNQVTAALIQWFTDSLS